MLRGCANDHFDILFQRISSVHFPSKAEKDGTRERRNERKGVYFPHESAF